MNPLYIFGCVQVFFVCEFFKSLEDVDVRYENCVQMVRYAFDTLQDAKQACGALHYHEQFDQFVANLFCMVGVVTFLVSSTAISSDNIRYWFVCVVSSMIYIFLQSIALFQFSIDTDSISSLSTERWFLVYLGAFGILILVVRQLALRRVTYRLLFVPVLLYILSMVLRVNYGGITGAHLHHVIASGILSLFASQTWYLHAVCIGIVIQGINYYGPQTVLLFQSTGVESPSTSFILLVNTIWATLTVLYWCVNRHVL